MPSFKQWVVYMVICNDNTIYTGITNDLKKRIDTHNSGRGAKYTQGRTPVKLVAYWNCENSSAAAKLEYQYKKLTRAEKQKLIKDHESIN